MYQGETTDEEVCMTIFCQTYLRYRHVHLLTNKKRDLLTWVHITGTFFHLGGGGGCVSAQVISRA